MHEILKDYLDYNPNTGIFTWSKKPSRKINIGSKAGTLDDNGYITIMFKQKTYKAHRLAWFMTHGYMPLGYVDHINHDRSDNRLCNLREVTPQQNNMNRTRRTSVVDEAGIWFCTRRKRYIAEIKLAGKKVYQRTFPTVDEAIEHRKAKLLELGFHPNHGAKK